MLRELRAERHESLASPRQLARFLCGLPSPQASRERLARHKWFGAARGRAVPDVLAFAEKTR